MSQTPTAFMFVEGIFTHPHSPCEPRRSFGSGLVTVSVFQLVATTTAKGDGVSEEARSAVKGEEVSQKTGKQTEELRWKSLSQHSRFP